MATNRADKEADNVDIADYTDNGTKADPMDQSGTTPTTNERTHVSQSDCSSDGEANDDLGEGGNLVIVAETPQEKMEKRIEAECQRQRDELVLYYIDDITLSIHSYLLLTRLYEALRLMSEDGRKINIENIRRKNYFGSKVDIEKTRQIRVFKRLQEFEIGFFKHGTHMGERRIKF